MPLPQPHSAAPSPAAEMIMLGENRRLALRQAGAGQDIVLIHGALVTMEDWLTGAFAPLSRLGRVIALDRPGHGDSRRPRLSGNPREQAAQIAAGLARIGAAAPLVVAHSYGARVGLALAATGIARRLILLAPAAFREVRLLEHLLLAPRATPFFGPAWAAGIAPWADRAWIERVHLLMFAPEAPPPAWRAAYRWDRVLDAGAMVREGEDMADLHPLVPTPDLDFQAVRVPVDIIAGSGDLIIDYRTQAAALAAMLPGARLRLVRGAGHMLHHSHAALLVDTVAAALRAEH